MKKKITFSDIRDEVLQIRKTYSYLKDDSAFVLWFLRAFLADSEESAKKALTSDTGDKNIDAILIDERAKNVHLIQGKFHQSLGEFAEKRNDVIAFSSLGLKPWQSRDELAAFYAKLDPLVKQKFEELIHFVRRNKYELKLYYVTTGRVSSTIQNEATDNLRHANGPVDISIYDAKSVSLIFKDYLIGVAPAVPALSLKIASEDTIRSEGVIRRFDPEKRIESWVFSMSARDVGKMFADAGIRLFARNIRGYLGQSNAINEAMADTIHDEPSNFWYYNNGVTIICDDAKRETQAGHDVLRVERPQVINGQQTTRTLCETASSRRASVLVKVIKVPRKDGDDDYYDNLVCKIVQATNWQNAIRLSDLIANDHKQVFIERELRKRGYQYLRKRQTKLEARRMFGSQGYRQIKKEDIAAAVAACEFDSSLVLKGREILFNERYYRSIFNSSSLSFYLSRYWLMRQVQARVAKHPERSYAKWLVLHFAWRQLADHIGSGFGERRFREACERTNKEALIPLRMALEAVFKAALSFYRIRRGSGEEAVDRQTFFKQSRLDGPFELFWSHSKNSHRKTGERAIKRFLGKLQQVELLE